MGAESIKRDMQLFQASIKKMSAGIGRAAILWKDEKFSELTASVNEVANISKAMMVSGERCCSSVESFKKIASEKY